MKLDLDQAWQSGLRFTRNNAGLLTVIAGLLFFLPTAIFDLMYQAPDVPEGATWEEFLAIVSDFWRETWWINLIALLLSSIGSLAIYRLAASRDARTVSDALLDALKGVLPMIGAALLIAIPVAAMFSVLLAIGGPAIFLVLLAIPATIWISMRTILVGAVVMAEGDFNPVSMIKRSFALTKGNSARIFFFLLLLLIAAGVLLAVLSAVLGLIFIAVAGGDTGKNLLIIVSALLESAVTVFIIACIAMIYRQLSSAAAPRPSVPPTVED